MGIDRFGRRSVFPSRWAIKNGHILELYIFFIPVFVDSKCGKIDQMKMLGIHKSWVHFLFHPTQAVTQSLSHPRFFDRCLNVRLKPVHSWGAAIFCVYSKSRAHRFFSLLDLYYFCFLFFLSCICAMCVLWNSCSRYTNAFASAYSFSSS